MGLCWKHSQHHLRLPLLHCNIQVTICSRWLVYHTTQRSSHCLFKMSLAYYKISNPFFLSPELVEVLVFLLALMPWASSSTFLLFFMFYIPLKCLIMFVCSSPNNHPHHHHHRSKFRIHWKWLVTWPLVFFSPTPSFLSPNTCPLGLGRENVCHKFSLDLRAYGIRPRV